MEAPIVKNQNYIMVVSSFGSDGEGVGRINGFTVFVPGAIKGEKVEVRIVKVNKSFAYGKLVMIIEASPARVEPFCESYKYCGGCILQHMSYNRQLEFKAEKVEEALKRIGRIENAVVHDTIGMDDAFAYRNKAQFPVGQADGLPQIGFYYPRSHRVVDLPECGIQHEMCNVVMDVMRNVIKENEIPVYDEATCEGVIRHIVVRVGYRTGDVMVVVATNGKSLPGREIIVGALKERITGLKSVVQNINDKDTNVILGKENVTLYGTDTIEDYIGEFRFKVSPLSFLQVNPRQTETLYGKALEYAGLKGHETVFDLYCGIGTISLFLCRKAYRVYGVESVPEAVEDARENARINGIENVEFVVGQAERVVSELYGRGIKADVVVVDPPRKGCDEELLRTVAEMGVERVVYVSCNPATLARDLGYLQERGYRVVEVQPVDMFPHTGHVETVVLMSRVKE